MNLVIIGSSKALLPGLYQAITWTKQTLMNKLQW